MRTPEEIKSDIESVEIKAEFLLRDILKKDGELKRLQKALDALDQKYVQLIFDLTKYKTELNAIENTNREVIK